MTGSIVNSEKLNNVLIFSNISEMALALSDFLEVEFNKSVSQNKSFHMALSGGSTPLKIFDILAQKILTRPDLSFLNLYWGDERCVPPDDPESNYGNMFNGPLKSCTVPEGNIYRIMGENYPDSESVRYSEVLNKKIPKYAGIPQLDLILLGIGEDGHTASIFPGADPEFCGTGNCYVAIHPQTMQKRVTMSLSVINNAGKVIFLATGGSKADIIKKIIEREPGYQMYPAALVRPVNGSMQWFLDRDAASKLKQS
jgi:6-phosphogluconolactonase